MRKTILITGASSGLGDGMAREFAAMGRNLALCARRTERLDALKAELESKHPGIKVIVKALDVNEYDTVFRIFREVQEEFGSIDRIIVNAGVGQGKRIGTGHFSQNVQTAQTNFVAALAQCEAAVEIFRKQNSGHLVTISSMSAVRGLPKHLTTYAATKAGLASLSEGIHAELMATPIKVSTIFPGYIRTEINEGAPKLPFEVDAKTGSQLLVKAIEREPAKASVPWWPWGPMGFLMRILPLSVVVKLT
ncbi:SDR family oxidoreductase [Phyllobacterium sp. 628]|nr:SDR family oxidoreductase [Phyllobacterium sp. 628]